MEIKEGTAVAPLIPSLLRMVYDHEQELLVGRHHDLVLPQLEPDEGQVVVLW